MPSLSYRSGLFLALACAWLVPAYAEGTPSPFLPGGTTDVVHASDDTDCELVGVISSSKQTLVGINEKTVHRSLWIAVGKTIDGVEVVSCDSKQDRAVIRIGGQLRTITMHAVPTTTTPASQVKIATVNAPINAPVAQPAVMTEQEQKENEARMLVSDLMEIGMQQRKAYEDAQRAGKKTK